MSDVIHVRGQGGARFVLDLPLHEAIADQLAKGELVRINEDGSEPFTGEDVPAGSADAPEATSPAPDAPVDGSGDVQAQEVAPEPIISPTE